MKKKEKILDVDNVLIDVKGLAWGGPKKDKRKKQKDKKSKKVTLNVHNSICN